MTEGESTHAGGVVVVMGVSGSGKSAVGAAAAARLGWAFVDADDLHPPANVAAMRAGIPLTDDDRVPWLRAVREAMDAATAAGPGAIVACSALRRTYRDTLRAGRPAIVFVHLDVPLTILRRRVSDRDHAFMPPSLLESQLATLESPATDEPGVIIDGGGPLGAVVDAVVTIAKGGRPHDGAGA